MVERRLLSSALALGLAALLGGCAARSREDGGARAAGEVRAANRETRAAILRAEDCRVVDDPLLAAVESQSAGIRAMAARALSRIGGDEARARLGALVSDPDHEVRAAAAFGLGLLGGAAAVEPLAGAAADESVQVRIHAAAGLAALDVPESAPALESLLSDPVPEVVLAAAHAIGGMEHAAFAVDRLVELADASGPVAVAATHSLALLSADSSRVSFDARRRVRTVLLDLHKSRSAEIRLCVAKGLNVPVGDAEAAALGLLSKDPDPRVRVAAVDSLAFPGAPVRPFLSETLRDADERVVLASVQGLARMRGADVIELLAAIVVHDTRPWQREAAAAAMRTVDPDYAAGAARGLAKDPEVGVRRAAAGHVRGRSDAESLGVAERLAEDEDPTVRRLAVLALSGSPELPADLLAARLSDDAPGVRAAVVEALQERLAREDLPDVDREVGLGLLERAVGAASEEGDTDLLGAAVSAAGRFGADPRARALLERGLASRSHTVRRRAAEEIARVHGEDVAESVGLPCDRPLEDYARIADWAAIPRAAVVTLERPGFLPGRFTLQLDTTNAPLTAWNFAELSDRGFYDGTPVWRVAPNYAIQGGDPRGDGSGGAGYSIRDEPAPDLFAAGTLAMLSRGPYGASSQWFITLTAQPQLLGRYTAFGRVVQNFDGVVTQAMPGDRVVRSAVYAGDGTEPLPPLE